MAEKQMRSMKIRIPGVEIEAPEMTAKTIDIKASRTFRISAARAGAQDAPVIETEPDEVVEIELEDGTRLWTSRQRLFAELIPLQERRSVDDVFEMPASISRQGASRGIIGKILIKTLRFFKIDVPEYAAKIIAKRWEDHTLGPADDRKGPGLYRLATGDQFELSPWDAQAGSLPADRPVLLLIHGTGSSTRGSFGGLWAPDRGTFRKQLFAPYQGNVFGLQHRTLSEGPVANTIELCRSLPAGVRLHVVSHSRGGLVGELLCRGQMEGGRDPFSAEELELFRQWDPDGQRGNLKELNDLLKQRCIRVERFVRVASPARGTTLASEHFDIFLSVLFHLLQKAPFFEAGPGAIAYDILTELIMAVAMERSDPSVLPGLEAVVPGTPLVTLLNRPDCQVKGELRVIAGDIEGGTLASTLETLLTDPLYLADNDLVVNTDAMFGGAERTGGAAFSFHQGPNVSHFHYFKNEDSSNRLLKALTRAEGEADGFTPFNVHASDDEEPPYRRGAPGERPMVYLLPDMMGSHLAVGDDRVWLDPAGLAFGGIARLAMDAPGVRPQEPIWMVYGNLVKHLSSIFQVATFPYDWRRSLAEEAERLAEDLSHVLDTLERSNLPVSIVAHSMGGLLARAMIASRPDVWQRMGKNPGSRLIMLGVPNNGSYAIPRILTGRDSLIKKLALLDLKHDVNGLLQVISTYPGFLELLPEKLFDPDLWAKLADADPVRDDWHKPADEALSEAHKVRKLIEAGRPPDLDRMLYVAGCAPATPVDLSIEEDHDGQGRLVFHATPCGDGRVPWETGKLPGVRTWYMRAHHGDLASYQDGFDAILELLQKGTTDRLETTPPETRGLPDRFILPEEKVPLYPDFKDLARSALGGSRERERRRPENRTRVTVQHGNLAYAGYPVMVGHYEGDAIVSAEAYLDRVQDGRLRRWHRLGRYPGADNTAEVFLKDPQEPKGAIVIGLGAVGVLSPGSLARAVSRGVRAYAIALAEVLSETAKQFSAGISALMVGTGAGGVSVEDSLTGILRGIAHAKTWLHESGYDERVSIDNVEFLELYEDRAIQAAHALGRVRNAPEISRGFVIDVFPRINRLDGGRRRASYSEDDPWWQRLEIIEDSAQRLRFNLLTDRARAEVYTQSSQRSLADQFITDMVKTNATSPEVAATLFEMLIPNEIKEYAPDQRDVLLVLNEAAARYPWEMMQERRPGSDLQSSDAKPLAVQAGMIRQLELEEFRQVVVRARGTKALVVGNPPTPFVSLPGAEVEARKVLELLHDFGFDPLSLVGKEADSREILKALYAHDYRIVHLAGHGVYEFQVDKDLTCTHCHQKILENKVTGMVIGDKQFLTPAQFHQMRAVPELVFINCCNLGMVEDRNAWHPPKLAANVATEFIRMGVRAVVAAGWEVDDTAAQTFAAVFYREMLSGALFGHAVHAARLEVFDAQPAGNTWGAYQCYGDPAFTLFQRSRTPAPRRRETQFTAMAEALVELANIAEDARTAADDQRTELRARVSEIDELLPDEWRKTGEIKAALGRAYGELDLFAEAIEHYQASLADEKAGFPLRAVEQLCNLEARRAVEIACSAISKPEAEAEKLIEEAKKLIGRAKKRVNRLIKAAGRTTERLSILGGIAKREAVIAQPLNQKHRALRYMAEHYEKAYQHKLDTCKETDPYPLGNWMAAEVLLHLTGALPAKPKDLRARSQEALDAAAERHRSAPNFWDAIEPPGWLVLLHLADRDLPEPAHTKKIIAGYWKAKKGYGSPREIRSVVEHLDFLANVIAVAPDEKLRNELVAAIAEIRRGLTADAPPPSISPAGE